MARSLTSANAISELSGLRRPEWGWGRGEGRGEAHPGNATLPTPAGGAPQGGPRRHWARAGRPRPSAPPVCCPPAVCGRRVWARARLRLVSGSRPAPPGRGQRRRGWVRGGRRHERLVTSEVAVEPGSWRVETADSAPRPARAHLSGWGGAARGVLSRNRVLPAAPPFPLQLLLPPLIDSDELGVCTRVCALLPNRRR